jgi:6-carboxyhexanoate--CoA ligase
MHGSVGVGDNDKHVTGAERLVPDENLEHAIEAMSVRAKQRGADAFQITTEKVAHSQCEHISCLPIQTVIANGADNAADVARMLLRTVSIDERVADNALTALTVGMTPGRAPMRGASLWDMTTGQRLEPDLNRGVRTSRFDFSPAGSAEIDKALSTADLKHFRTREAVAVASKTLWAGVVAELCWSDEPGYDTGYIATAQRGYVRIPGFKPTAAVGGRIFFVDSQTFDIDSLIDRLQCRFVLIDPPITILPPLTSKQMYIP